MERRMYMRQKGTHPLELKPNEGMPKEIAQQVRLEGGREVFFASRPT